MAEIQDTSKAYLRATFDSRTGNFCSDFGGNGTTLSTLLGGCLAHIAERIGEGDPEQSRAYLIRLTRESFKFAFNILDDLEKWRI